MADVVRETTARQRARNGGDGVKIIHALDDRTHPAAPRN
jgi:hypothetical protein